MQLPSHSPACGIVLSGKDIAVAGDFTAMADGFMEAPGSTGPGRNKGRGK
jgi:hypothetical protein